uniref:Uncharacterized protein n=1 Tax=Anguilla anguilla TaxID=7936 RepID=A0A0E9XNP4_ANGAN
MLGGSNSSGLTLFSFFFQRAVTVPENSMSPYTVQEKSQCQTQ